MFLFTWELFILNWEILLSVILLLHEQSVSKHNLAELHTWMVAAELVVALTGSRKGHGVYGQFFLHYHSIGGSYGDSSVFHNISFGASGLLKHRMSCFELEMPAWRYRKPVSRHDYLSSTVAVCFHSTCWVVLYISACLSSLGKVDKVSSWFSSRRSRKRHQLQQTD